jgi:hypothetical protein
MTIFTVAFQALDATPHMNRDAGAASRAKEDATGLVCTGSVQSAPSWYSLGRPAFCSALPLHSNSIGRFGHPPARLFCTVRSVLTYCKHHLISLYIGSLRVEFIWKYEG